MAITGRSLNDRVFDAINYTLLTLVLLIVAYPLLFVISSSFSDPLAVMGGKVWMWPVKPNLKAYRMVFQSPTHDGVQKHACVYGHRHSTEPRDDDGRGVSAVPPQSPG